MSYLLLGVTIVVSSFVTMGLTLGLVFNRKVLKWYCKYTMKVANELAAEMFDSEKGETQA